MTYVTCSCCRDKVRRNQAQNVGTSSRPVWLCPRCAQVFNRAVAEPFLRRVRREVRTQRED